MKIGITGGIGSGKSYICRLLEKRGYAVYDCDSAAKRLILSSPFIRRRLTALIGPHTYLADGSLNKRHPAVFRDFIESGMEWMESAIIYESGIYRLVDRVIVVTAPEELRIRRVMARDEISREKVLEWMSRQLPQEEVRQRADFEIVNDGLADIEQQLNHIIEQCNRQF